MRTQVVPTAASTKGSAISATTISPRRLAEFHAAGYLPKPFPLETLTSTIERLLHPEGALDG